MPEHVCVSDSPSGGCSLCYRDMHVLASQCVAWMTGTDPYHTAMRQLARLMVWCEMELRAQETCAHLRGVDVHVPIDVCRRDQVVWLTTASDLVGVEWRGRLMDPEDRQVRFVR